jgi:hypothetical protein
MRDWLRRVTCWGIVGGSLVMLGAACGGEPPSSPSDRGYGLETASRSIDQRAAAYAAALRGAFDVGPGLVLLLNPAILPRSREAAPRDTLPPGVARALRGLGVVQGTCTATAPSPRVAPICPGAAAGYEVQFSDLYRLGRDTVQLFLTVERYRPARDTTGYQPPLRFEERYALARSGDGWSVVRQERLAH